MRNTTDNPTTSVNLMHRHNDIRPYMEYLNIDGVATGGFHSFNIPGQLFGDQMVPWRADPS